MGKPLRVWNVLTTVVGITPPGFVGVFDDDPPVVYLPITTYAGNNPNMGDRSEYFTHYNWGWMDMMVRRKAGVTVERANADLTQAMVKSWDLYVEQEPGVTPRAIARPAALVGSLKQAAGPDPSVEARTVWWVSGIAIVVLLIACSNVANLFLARALQRRRETAVRIALGGGRARLMRQWFTEALVLAVLGCAAGILVAQWGGAGIRALFVGEGAPIAVATDWRTLGLAMALSLAAALLTGLAPALVSMQRGIAAALKAGVREGTHQRSGVRAGLVIFQVSLSLVLLVGAGLFVRSFSKVRTMRLGFELDRQVLVTRNMRGAEVPDSALVALRRSDARGGAVESRGGARRGGEQRPLLEHVEPVALRRRDRQRAPAGAFHLPDRNRRLLRHDGDAHPAGPSLRRARSSGNGTRRRGERIDGGQTLARQGCARAADEGGERHVGIHDGDRHRRGRGAERVHRG